MAARHMRGVHQRAGGTHAEAHDDNLRSQDTIPERSARFEHCEPGQTLTRALAPRGRNAAQAGKRESTPVSGNVTAPCPGGSITRRKQPPFGQA